MMALISRFSWRKIMPSLVVTNLDESMVIALKERAVAHQRSTEAKHKASLADVLSKPRRKSLLKHY